MKKLIIALLGLGIVSVSAYAAETVPASTQTTTTTATTTATTTTSDTQSPAIQNLTAGDAFLKNNKTQPNVVTLPDGLQYTVIKKGTGPIPSDTDTVTVNYEGKLINGTEFDSSYKRGQPATFPVNGVIPGWTEALKLMPAGSTWMLYIPATLAYGENGAPPAIGPNETLIFKVELISVNKS